MWSQVKSRSCAWVSSRQSWKKPTWLETCYCKETFSWVSTSQWWRKWTSSKTKGSSRWHKSSLLRRWPGVAAFYQKHVHCLVRKKMMGITSLSGSSTNWRKPTAIKTSRRSILMRALFLTRMKMMSDMECKRFIEFNVFILINWLIIDLMY